MAVRSCGKLAMDGQTQALLSIFFGGGTETAEIYLESFIRQ